MNIWHWDDAPEMLTEYQRGSIFGAVLIAVAFAASISTVQYEKYPLSGSATNSNKQGGFWETASTDPVAVFTGALVVVGGIQATLFLWQLTLIRRNLVDTKEAADAAKLSSDVAYKSLLLSKETAQRQLRAYVSLKQFGKNAIVDSKSNAIIGWSFNIVWQNTGATPTRDMLSHASIRFESNNVPDDFRFTDMWIIGKEQVYYPTTLLSKGTFTDDIGAFSIEQLQEVIRGNKTLYFYGWADYNDVFSDTERHRTEFCAQVLFPGDPTRNNDGNIGFYIYLKHNGTDDECMRKPKTYIERERIIDFRAGSAR
jgi:hypothetical protein